MLEQFDCVPQLQKLLQKNNPKCMVCYRDMPETHQLAIAHYMSVDGAAWAYNHPAFEDWLWGEGTPYEPQMRLEMLEDLRKFLPRFIEHFGGVPFGMADLPCQDLQEVIKECNPYYEESDFLNAVSQIRGSYETPTWPSILHDSEEILQDGWTRFHDRISLKIEMTPVVWYE